MNRRYYFDEQDDMDDATYQWLDSDYADFKKARLGKLPRKRGRRGDDHESRRTDRRTKRDRLRTH